MGRNGDCPILPNLTLSRLALVTSPAAAPLGHVAVLVPAFAALAPALADLVAVLPLRSVNRSLVDALALGPPPACPVIAGVLAVDPFLNGPALYGVLARSGVAGVVNLPSVGPADGDLERAFAVAGLGAERELPALALARREGLEPVAQVFSLAEAARAVDLGIRRMILHPGLPSGEPGQDRKLAEAASATLLRLRRQGIEVALYRHPDLAALLPGGADDAGQLVWRVEGIPRDPSP